MFYNFHCHSVYSQQDAMSEPIDIAEINKKMGNDAFCITDHGSLGGWIQGYLAAEKTGLQFIPGCEFYLKPEDEFFVWNKKNNDEIEVHKEAVKYHHLLCIAKDQDGVQSLISLYNSGTKRYGKMCITREALFENSKGVIVSTACIAGEVIYYIRLGMVDKAESILKMYKDQFGDDFYVELQWHNLVRIKGEAETYGTLVELAKKLGIAMIFTTDSHFNYKEDANDHNVYKALYKIGGGEAPYDYETHSFYKVFDGDGYYIMDEDEVRERISHIPGLSHDDMEEVIANTSKLRSKCEVTKFPEAKPLSDCSEELRKRVEAGFDLKRKGTEYEEESRKRIEFELKTIEDMHFTEYFINVQTIIDRAKSLGIMPGPARGSGAGSEVNFLLGITQIDPLKNGLMFERFLNPARFNYPDIDLDIQSDSGIPGKSGKDVLIESLSDKFPFNGQIVNEMRATTVTLFKKLASAMGIPFNIANKVSTDSEVANDFLMRDDYDGWLPDQLSKLKIPFDFKWQELEKYMYFCYKYGGNKRGDNASGLLYNTSIHASGVILYPDDNKNVLPKNDQGVTYRGHALEKMGYIKYDILSLDAVNPINRFIDRIEKDTGKKFDWEDCYDEETWKTIQNADTDFVFQFSSPGMKRALKVVKPSSISKLAELNSLYRPGCIQAGIFDRYLANDWSNEEKIVGRFLKNEFGEDHSYAMIFQEDIMKVVQKMGGFSLADADLIRRAMGRKEKDTMASYKKQFIDGFDVDEYGDIAETVWNTIEAFATYTFNKSHSVAYSCLAYWMAYIFTHYKNEYLQYLLNAGKQKQEVIEYLSKDHKIVYPSLTTQNTEFIVTDTELILPTVSPQEHTSLGEYLLNLDADKNKMIVKYGILDDYCADRKGLRDLFKTIDKKKIAKLPDTQIEALYASTSVKDLIGKLSAIDLIDYKKEPGKYVVTVKKARSEKVLELMTALTPEILKHNCQEDVRAYGIVRSKYCDSMPPIPLDEIVERMATIADDFVDKRFILRKMAEALPSVRRINSPNNWVNVVCKETSIGSWASATIAFDNAIVKMSIPKPLVSEFKAYDKNEPIEIRFNVEFYYNKDGSISYSLRIVEANRRRI